MSTSSAEDIWEAAKGALQLQVSRANFETWLKDTVGVSYQDNLFIVGTPSTFAAEWLSKRLHSLVKKTLMGITGEDTEVEFQVYPPSEGLPESKPRRRSSGNGSRETAFPPSPPRLNPRYTFDTFIVGSCNRLAHAAALSVAENPGHSYNPLFIYGGVGLGKTHLLHAIGHVASATHCNLIYVSTEQFTNEFINAIKERRMEDFRNKFRSVDLLLIDDIQFISGKEQTQEGFFHTFNDLHNANRQIVITSDRPPRALSLLEDRLRSRFEWGLIADIQPPDLETRLAILRAKAEQQQMVLDPEIIEFIARRAQRNIRELEGCLNRIIAYSRLTRTPPTLELAEQALQDLALADRQQRPLSPDSIMEAVCHYFRLTPEMLRSEKREQPIALARQIAMYLIREETRCSLSEVGQLLGGRDHSTVLHGCEKIATQINIDPKLRGDILEIRQRLHSLATPSRFQ
jgi:chromosomal replication initiator protein